MVHSVPSNSSQSQQSHLPANPCPEPWEDATTGVDCTQPLPVQVEAVAARAAVTRIVNNSEQAAKQLVRPCTRDNMQNMYSSRALLSASHLC